MKSKKLIWFFCLLWSMTLPAKAQEPSDSLAYVYSIWNSKQRQTINLHLQLTGPEKSAFWDVYDSYCQAVEFLEMDYLQIAHWTNKYSNSPKSEAINYLYDDLLKNDYLMAKIRRQYYRKFQRVLSPTNAIEFMRLDQNMRTLFRMNMQKDATYNILSEIAFYSMTADQNK